MHRSIQPYPSPNGTQNNSSTYFPANAASEPPPPDPSALIQLTGDDGARPDASPYATHPPMATGAEDAQQFAAHASTLSGHAPQTPTAEHLAHGVLNMEDQRQQATPETSNSRRKPKTSKACDECRRKKIRCDITTDNPTHACGACRRTGSGCQFSRQQLKRGPSKGYIKELATRLSSLESQLGPQAHQYAGSAYAMSPGDQNAAQYGAMAVQEAQMTEDGQFTRKRTYADMNEPAAQPMSNNQFMTESPDSLRHSIYEQSTPVRAPFQPPPQAAAGSGGMWRYDANSTSQRQAVGVPHGQDTREVDTEAPQGWNEPVVDEYYRLVHQTFPLLPHSKLRLKSRLTNCPGTIRHAFLVALDTAMRDSPTSKLPSFDTSEGARQAASLLAVSQFEDTFNRTMSANLIYIQTLILMALESDHHGPASMKGQIGPPRAEWLGRAVSMAMQLKLNTLHSKDRFGEGNPDADEKLGRRVWWILFILDRWHASSTAQLLQLSENSGSLLLEDQSLLGDSTYHLARMSFILGHLSAILQQPPSLMSRESAAAPIVTTLILGELDRFRESVESVLLGAPNLVHLSYWHVKLMVLRLTPSTTAADLLTPATRMASILNSSYTPLTPINHHFAALASMTLVELADFEETREGARRGIDDILEAHSSQRGFEGRENSTGWDGAIRELLAKSKAQIESRPPGETGGTLRHLADAAVAGSGGAGTSDTASIASAFDPTRMTRFGYLAALVQESRL